MRNLFIGFIFIFLDFNLNLGRCALGLIPDFVGYYFIIKGLQELSGTNTYFEKCKPIASGMMIYSIVLYLMDLFGVSSRLGLFIFIFAVVNLAGYLYVTYLITLGVKELEASSYLHLNGDVLLSRWKLMAICQAISIPLSIIPFINVIIILTCFVINILYLIAFNNTKNSYIA